MPVPEQEKLLLPIPRDQHVAIADIEPDMRRSVLAYIDALDEKDGKKDGIVQRSQIIGLLDQSEAAMLNIVYPPKDALEIVQNPVGAVFEAMDRQRASLYLRDITAPFRAEIAQYPETISAGGLKEDITRILAEQMRAADRNAHGQADWQLSIEDVANYTAKNPNVALDIVRQLNPNNTRQ